ncbi:hypothetical protein FQK07_04700 [Synechococcus sp. BSF8S]|nr:hypothetical protein [Synechococcus sp. BSF8S]MBC1263225.1 hypothetical protein [Synechococcus sp. BSA11S]
MSFPHHSVPPVALSWQRNGELAPQDLFNLVCRLRAVEPGTHSNELWRLGQKYPRVSPFGRKPRRH